MQLMGYFKRPLLLEETEGWSFVLAIKYRIFVCVFEQFVI